jgi:hypothetical protein
MEYHKNKEKVIKMKKKNTELVVREEVKGTPALLISQAIAKGMDLDKLEKLLVLQERYEANEARKAYHKAMAAFKANLPQIIKDKKVNYAAGGGQVRYSHASLFNVMNNLNPALSKYGLSAAWTHKQTEKELAVTCRITHKLGYSEETTLVGPADNTGSKNAIQAIGSTNSYLERYTVLALLGIATKDQDDDGKAAGSVVEYIDDKQLSQLLDIIDNNKVSKSKFLAYLKIEKFEELPKADFQKAIAALQNIIKGGKP